MDDTTTTEPKPKSKPRPKSPPKPKETPEERAAKNRNNSLRSTGPRSERGKRRVARNAYKHGMRCETIAIITDDLEATQGLHDAWLDCYKPQTPGEHALLDRCVFYTHQFHHIVATGTEVVNEQIRAAPLKWDREQADAIKALAGELDDDPAATHAALFDTAAGCRYLLAEWAPLKATLDVDGCWYVPSQRDRALRLLGLDPEAPGNEDVFSLSRANHFAMESPNAEHTAWYLDPSNIPDMLRRPFREEPPDRAACVAKLRACVGDMLVVLRGREHYLRVTIEEPSRAGAPTRAKLADGEAGCRVIRYMKMNDTSFHRARKALIQGDEREFTEAQREEEEEAGRATDDAFLAQERTKVDEYNAEAAAEADGKRSEPLYRNS